MRDGLEDLYLRGTNRPLIARIDASRLTATSLGGITDELCCIDSFPNLSNVGGIRVKLVPHREGADNFTVSTQSATALPYTDVVHHQALPSCEGFNAFSSASCTPCGVGYRSAPPTWRNSSSSFSSSWTDIPVQRPSSRPRSPGWGPSSWRMCR